MPEGAGAPISPRLRLSPLSRDARAALRAWRTGIQRYRCLDCRRTFNDLTHTAMAGTRLRAKWTAYGDTMRDALSTRQPAAVLDIDHKTVWRWRHKVIAHLAPEAQPPLEGIVEADETYLRRNFKGSRPVGRRHRKRGTENGTVNSYQGRLQGWMGRFRGVATKYLHRYLTWHVLHERVKARLVLLGNTAEFAAHRRCPDCVAVLSAA